MSEDGIWTGNGPYPIGWDRFGVLMSELVADIIQERFRPDAICAISRGGLIPAGYLAAALEVERMDIVRVRRTVDDRIYADKQAPSLRGRPGGLQGCTRPLIVDDVIGTGSTAALVDAYVRDQTDGDVRCATLAYNPRSAFRPHYHALEIDDWIVFPWEPAPAARQEDDPDR